MKLLLTSFLFLCFLTSYSQETKVEPKDSTNEELIKVVEIMPRFPGCENIAGDVKEKNKCAQEKLLQYIYKNVKYPELARINNIEGMVVLQFVINKDGLIENIEVKRKVGGGCDEAAVAVVERMNDMEEKWTAGTQDGKPVKVAYTLPIKFKLQGKKKKKRLFKKN